MDTNICLLVSVVIPVYNAEPYLTVCIESVVNQTYRKLEIILVDDGSTDGSPAICDGFAAADPRVRVIHKKNEGLVRARKTGVSLAKGDYVTYVDADDWIDPDTYETVLKKREGAGADIILYGLTEEYMDCSVVKENLAAEGYYAGWEIKEKIYPQMLDGGVFFRFGILPNLVCKLVRRELLWRIQTQVSDSVQVGEDADCTFQMLLQAESIQIMRYAPYHYRKRTDSMVWGRTSISQSRNLYFDLKNAFEQSAERDILMPQLHSYMLFILLLKSAESFLKRGVFDKYFAGKKIVLYGAGGFGREIHHLLGEEQAGEIVLWADRKYERYREAGLPVSSPDELINCVYDGIFIAILDTQLCAKIAEELIEKGVSADAIGYVRPDETYVQALLSVLEETEMKKCLVWGTGNKAEEYFKGFELAGLNNDIEIVGFIDNDVTKRNGAFHGVKIYSPMDIAGLDCDFIDLWVANGREDIEKQIKELGIESQKVQSAFQSYFQKINDRYANTSDDETKSFLHIMNQQNEPCVYAYKPAGQYGWKEAVYDENKDLYYVWFEGKRLYLSPEYKFTIKDGKRYAYDFWWEQDDNSPHRYEENDIVVEEGDVLVDAGVCEGNFSLHHIDKAGKIYLIECDSNWMRALRATFEPYKDKVVFCNKFLGDCDTDTRITLNSLVREPVNFIKMDIEGEEINALRGSDRVFADSDHIKCSICSYHKHGDEEEIRTILRKYGLRTEVSTGYMLFTYDAEIWRNPELRRGIVRGRKG